jgi:hypothetical protein
MRGRSSLCIFIVMYEYTKLTMVGMAFPLLLAFTGAQAQHRASAQTRTITYTPDTTDFPNPERGFYIPMGTSASQFYPLETARLKRLFAGPQRVGNARYTIQSTLLMREYTLDTFRQQPLSQGFLDGVDHDLSAIREASLKVILRFAYTNSTTTGNCPDANKICPPYGDAPKSIVLGHIALLAPLLQRHADIIAVLQEGFIGIWGENYYTDYFGDAGGNGPGRIMDSSWKDRNEVLHALLAALPEDRMVQVRTPQIKQKYVYGPDAGIYAPPLSARDGFSHTDAARIGFHNDCFLSGPDDYGTYYDYGSSDSPKKEANLPLRKYLQDDSRFVAVGGEACDDAYSPQNDCTPAGHAEEEMAAVHLSFLNVAYNNDVNNDWDSLGCISSIRQRLGYRFVLREARFPARATAGQPFTFRIRFHNAGYASPYNPRPVYLIFRNHVTGAEIALACPVGPRNWPCGDFIWKEILVLPAGTPAGKYDLLLNFPDNYPSIAKRPEYRTRLANENCWEPDTGYNKLNFMLTVDPPRTK